MYKKFTICVVGLILISLSIICHASSDDFENSDDCGYKRKIIDLDLKPESRFDKKLKSEDAQDDPDSSLPAEILVDIFSEVLLYDVIHCSQVCRAWHGAYRLLLTSSHVPLFCRYFLGYHERFEKDKAEKISMSEQEFAVNHLLLDDGILLEIQDHKIHNTSYTFYNSASFNNVSERMADIILTKSGSSFYIKGVEQHYQLIQQWYRKAPVKFDIIANMNIGYMYEHGKGVKQDFGTACEWYNKACYGSKENDRTHLPLIYYQLGRIYERWSHKRSVAHSNDDGPNVNDDIMNAKHYYQKAADQNQVDAKHCLDLLKTCE